MPTLTSVTKHFITSQEGFTTTTAGSVASGAATVTLNSVSGYTNGDQVAFVIDPTDVTKKQVFTGTIDTSGVQVTNVVWTEGTNQTHAAGATVVDYTTATHQAAMVKGVKVSLDDDGTLKAGAVDNSAAIADGVVSTAKIADDAVTPAKRSGGFYTAQITFSAGTGSKSLTGFGFQPKMVQVAAAISSGGTTYYSTGNAVDGSPISETFSAACADGSLDRTINGTTATFVSTDTSSNTYVASVTSFDADGITVNVTTDGGAAFRVWNVTAFG